MEVHLEQKQESGFLAMGITKEGCSQIPETPPHSPPPPLCRTSIRTSPEHTSPHRTCSVSQPHSSGLSDPTQELRGEI